MPLVSRIYAGPEANMSSNWGSKSAAKKNLGSKAKKWATTASNALVPSDRKRKPKSGMGTKVGYNAHVLTPTGWLTGYQVRKNQFGMFIRVNGHEIKVLPFESRLIKGIESGGCYIQKGYDVATCNLLRNDPRSKDYVREWE